MTRSAAAASTATVAYPEGTRILTFDPPDFTAGPGDYNPYLQTQNFDVGSDTGVFIQSAYTAGYPDNGTYYARSLISETHFFVRHSQSLPFTALGLDLSEYSTVFTSMMDVTFIGYKADGSTVQCTFTTDGIIDGTGAAVDFEHFTFPGTFNHLTKLVAQDTPFMVDNFAVLVEGTETPGPANPTPPRIYDLTWDAPKHVLDQVIGVGGPFAPASIKFGTPTVRSAIGSMIGPALELAGTGYQQIQFTLGRHAKRYRLQFDLYLNQGHDFRVIFDGARGVQDLAFSNAGALSVFQPYLTATLTGTKTFPLRKVTHVDIKVDLEAQIWTTFVDGVLQLTGPYDVFGGDIGDIRFHDGGSAAGNLGLDNLQIDADDTEVQAGPHLAVALNSYQFPDLTFNQEQSRSVTVQNVGSEPLIIQSATTTGPQISVDQSELPVTILPSGFYLFKLMITPSQFTPITDQLTLESNDADRPIVTVDLGATVQATPLLTLSLESLHLTMPANSRGNLLLGIANPGSGDLNWYLDLRPPGGVPVAYPWLRFGSSGGTIGASAAVNAPLLFKSWNARAGSVTQDLLVYSNVLNAEPATIPVVLSFIPNNSFTRWKVKTFGEFGLLNDTDSSRWNSQADPDQDTMSNLVEYLTGHDPQVLEWTALPTTVVKNGETLFEVRLRLKHAGVNCRVEWTPLVNPATWRASGLKVVSDTTAGVPPGFHKVRLKVTAPHDGAYRFRLNAKETAAPNWPE